MEAWPHGSMGLFCRDIGGEKRVEELGFLISDFGIAGATKKHGGMEALPHGAVLP